jgi:hypothetical protein
MPPVQAPMKTLNAGASEFVPHFGGFAEILPQFLDGSGTGTSEGHDDLEVFLYVHIKFSRRQIQWRISSME